MCTVNGVQVPCEEFGEAVGESFGALGIGIIIVVFLIGLLCTVFWVMMIVHAASKPVENKAVWIILMLLTGVVGALIYYFAVKRNFDSASLPPATPPATATM